jgi:uncharacterized membrane protein YhhN
MVSWPVITCAAATGLLLLAEYRRSQAGLWLAKPVASASFIWMALASNALGSTYGRLVLLALLLCMLGDLLLIPKDRKAVFRAGILAFLLGHVAYCAAFLTRPLSWTGLLLGGLVIGAVLLLVQRWLSGSLPSDMRIPVHAYLVVIGLMSVLAFGVTGAGGPVAVAGGALAFLLSDISVARDRFVRHEFTNRAWGLPLYYAGQMLLAASPGML